MIGYRGVLQYAKRDVFVRYKVDARPPPYRVVALFGSQGSSTTLSLGRW